MGRTVIDGESGDPVAVDVEVPTPTRGVGDCADAEPVDVDPAGRTNAEAVKDVPLAVAEAAAAFTDPGMLTVASMAAPVAVAVDATGETFGDPSLEAPDPDAADGLSEMLGAPG